MPAFCDNQCRIGDKSHRHATQPGFLSQMCPKGHRNAFLGCQVGRRLFLKASKVLAAVGVIVPEEIRFMEIGEFPAIEALAFAVCELKEDSHWRPQREQHHKRPTVLHRLGF